ncbi:MAG: DUF362 domain-containing protein [Candidatus Poribacteria bacterium]
MNRKEFIKAVSMGMLVTLFDPTDIFLRRAMSVTSYFGLHPFIESHPEAVFIKRTNVLAKMDSNAKKQEGFNFADEILTLRDTPGMPLNQLIAIKPNLTCASGRSNTEEGMGIITDPYFVEGMLEKMINLGLSADNIYMREGNWLGDSYCPNDAMTSPYIGVIERTGTHLIDFPTGRKIFSLSLNTMQEGTEIIWRDCPNGVVFKRVGYVAPFNQPGTWLLDIAKFKCHSMGMTLCVKNIQGMCVHPYIHFCEAISTTKNYPQNVTVNFQPDFDKRTQELYSKHLSEGIPRWDKPSDGYWMEVWAQKACDNAEISNVGLSIIEGIYGRNGNAFFNGPGPGGTAQDFMTNVIIFGKNPFLVDIIGHWMGGHEPGNFGLFHIAKERGLIKAFNPSAIPVYIWENGTPKLTPLYNLERFTLETPYLRRNYGGQNESQYHLVNEPYDYGPVNAVESYSKTKANTSKAEKPSVNIIGQNFPNPFNGSTNIEYTLLNDGYVTIEIYNSSGDRIDVLVNSWQKKGTHLVSWNASTRPSGIYFYLFKTNGFEKIGKMILSR